MIERASPRISAHVYALQRLAVHCEQWPSRRLDEQIAVATGSRSKGTPHYTTSLDDAVSLIPDGWGFTFRRHPSVMPNASIWRTLSEPSFDGTAKTLSAAVCAAALKARAFVARQEQASMQRGEATSSTPEELTDAAWVDDMEYDTKLAAAGAMLAALRAVLSAPHLNIGATTMARKQARDAIARAKVAGIKEN